MSTNPNSNSGKRLFLNSSKNQQWFLVITSIFITFGFIGAGYLFYKPGFPLDDSWIHQTYARNLAMTGLWEFTPGEISAGSTSPLWTMLLSLGYWIGIKSLFIWSTGLSVLISTFSTLFFYRILRKMLGDEGYTSLIGSFLFAVEWHMLWSNGSGMETALYCLFALLIVYLLIEGKRWLWIGFLAGLIVWVRPDGITFIGPVFLIFVWKWIKKKLSFKDLISLLVPLALLLILFGLFNFSLSGKILPNTFYAKQTEYAVNLMQPLWKRLGQVFTIPLAGAGFFLLPGFFNAIKITYRDKNLWLASILLWFLGYGTLYALRLPMTYQHGRYLFPLIPVFYLIGILGTKNIFDFLLKRNDKLSRLFNIVVVGVIACSLIFAIVGESAYITDIKTIDTYMVDPALWIQNNTQQDAIVAAHDIGALGYFGKRKIIDLAGLIQPEIIPIIRNEEQIKEYLQQKEANYLVVFKDWYSSFADFGTTVASFQNKEMNWKEIVEIKKLYSVNSK